MAKTWRQSRVSWLIRLVCMGGVAISGNVHAAVSPVTHVIAAGWQATDFQDLTNPGCSIGAASSVPGSRLIMGASRQNPTPVILILRKDGWAIPPSMTARVTAAFPDGTSIALVGHGQGQSAQFELFDPLLRQWIHELTSAAQLRLTFSGNEPSWMFDLTGTSKVVDAMGDCFKAHGITGVPPPFAPAADVPKPDQPFASVANETSPGMSSNQDAPTPSAAVPAILSPPPTALPRIPDSGKSEAASAIVGATAPAKQDTAALAEWHGNANMQTRPFHSDGSWELQWHNGAGFFAMTLHRMGTAASRTLIANGTDAASSSSFQPEAGDFYLEIESDSQWQVRAVSLPNVTQSEAVAPPSNTVEASLINPGGDQSGLPTCAESDSAATVKNLVEQSPAGQTFHLRVLHVSKPTSLTARDGLQLCRVTIMTNGGEGTYVYQYYRKEGEIYIFGKMVDK